MRTSLIKRLIVFFSKHWAPLLTMAGLLVAVSGWYLTQKQLDLQLEQQAYEQSQRPQLEYSESLVISEIDQQIISNASSQLVEDFFRRVSERTRTTANLSYLQAVDAVLPLTSTLPARRVSIALVIHNKGLATNTKVRAFVKADRPISASKVESLEPARIISGGVGESEVTIEFDRIVAGNSVTLTLDSAMVGGDIQLDQLILRKPTPKESLLGGNSISFQKFLGLNKCESFTEYFPCIYYFPAQKPKINADVTSDQRPGTRTTPTLGPTK